VVETGRKVFLALIVISVLIAPRLSQAQITPELVEAAKKEGEVMFYGAITAIPPKRSAMHSKKSMASSCTIGAAMPPN
jgi:hypothetical protein